jgi:hypothetical protein
VDIVLHFFGLGRPENPVTDLLFLSGKDLNNIPLVAGWIGFWHGENSLDK